MNIKYLSLYICLVLGSMLGTSCGNKSAKEHYVSVSILPQKYFVERIAGDYVKVNVMIPPGMNPATCDLITEQLKKLYDSDLCFAIGYLPFETTHLYPVLENKKDIRLVRHSDQVVLIPGSCEHQHEGHLHEGGVDPHIWLSPRHAKSMCQDIVTVLSEQYPDQKERFEQNYRLLAEDIDRIAAKADSILSGKSHKSFLIYHPALTYFAEDYNMEQISIEEEGKEPNPAHLKKIIDQVKEKDIHIIFIQSQFDVNNAKAIARETGCKVISIDPLSDDWMKEMNRLTDLLQENLN